MASLSGVQDRFDMGRVVNRAFGAISHNFALFLTLAILLSFIPGIVTRTLVFATQDPASGAGVGSALALTVSGLIGLAFSSVLMATVTYVTVVDLDKGQPQIASALGIGLRSALPLVLLSIVQAFGIGFAALLLLVPAVIVALMWSVSTPALVMEGLGVFASLGRSRELTKGSRWAIFGLLIAALLVMIIPLMIGPLLSGAFSGVAQARQDPLSIAALVTALFSAAAAAVFAAIIAAIYVELRTIKEGASSGSLAAIFA